jgi:phosphoheptose isomerase
MDAESRLLAVANASVDRSIATKGRLTRSAVPDIVRAAVLVQTALEQGGKVLLFGNGGSASDAQHIAAELVGRFVKERPGMPAIALNTDTSAMTAIGNDYGYDRVFARQVEALARSGDVVIGLSTSGNSPNVVAAFEAARDIGARIVAMTGGRASRCGELADVLVAVPDTETARVQECHILLGHILCELLDDTGDAPVPAPAVVHRGVTDELLAERDRWRRSGVRVAWTNGCFDLLHAGHVSSLRAARATADVLVVGLNSDASARRLKGAGRPVVGEDDRAELLVALGCVDRVVIFDGDTPTEIVAALQPDVWCKGADYEGRDPSTVPELAVVEAYGGEVSYLPLVEGRSTTSVIERLRGAAG